MKKLFPALIAGLIFLVALALMRPEPAVPVLVAARDLPAGHPLQAADLETRPFPRSLAPQGAFSDPEAVLGETLSLARSAGDVLYPAHLGGERLVLASDERAIALEVGDSSGLAGLLKPGDQVGLTAVIFGSSGQGAFAKTISGGFRVLYISPEFKAVDPLAYQPDPVEAGSPAGAGGYRAAPNRKDRGTVVLAVPVEARQVAYDFAAFGVESEARTLHLVDLLPALDHAQNVELSLFLEPEQPRKFTTSGVYLPSLVITPGPSPTPTETPPGGSLTPAPATPTPQPKP